MKTKVIFRVWTGKHKTGDDVIAIFPQVPGDSSAYTCLSYEHCGQHGSCNPEIVVQSSRLATPAEYKPLARELRRIGYRLDIAKRLNYADRQIIRRHLSSVTVFGEYNRQGYTVTTLRHGKAVDSYTAGNNPHDSTQPVVGAAITLRDSRRYCLKTCREIAAEKQGTFQGVTRIADE
jgi:hypothetical protein